MQTRIMDLLAQRMSALDINNTTLAAAVGVTDQAVGAWLRGAYTPRRTLFAAIAETLEVDVQEVAMAAAGLAPAGIAEE